MIKKVWLLMILSGVLFVGLFSYFYKDEPVNSGFKTIPPLEAHNILNQNEGAILLDVRTFQEHQLERIPGSLLIPLNELDLKVEGVIIDKSRTILVYCRSGVRSKEGATILINKGYNNVMDIGGINEWPYEKERS